jgi:hypothetical protein
MTVPEATKRFTSTRFCFCGHRISAMSQSDRCKGCLSKKWHSPADFPYAPSPCKKCGKVFKTRSQNVKYCPDCTPQTTFIDRERRVREKLAKENYAAEAAAAAEAKLQEELEKPESVEARQRMEQRRAAKRQGLVERFGEVATAQNEYEDSVYFMFHDALAYIKGEPQTLIQDDSDFADAEARLEELLAKYRYKQRDRWAIKLALETNPNNKQWMINNLGTTAFWATVPNLPPLKWFQNWRYTWQERIEAEKAKELTSKQWEGLIERPTIDEDFKLLRDYMTAHGFQVSDYEQPDIVAPWMIECGKPKTAEELKHLFELFLHGRQLTKEILDQWKNERIAEGWDNNKEHDQWLEFQEFQLAHPWNPLSLSTFDHYKSMASSG